MTTALSHSYRLGALESMHRSICLLLLALLPSCFGLVDETVTDGSPGGVDVGASAGGSGAGPEHPGAQAEGASPRPDEDCPPAQWDCSGVEVWCTETPERFTGLMSMTEKCRCDFSRPKSSGDCASNEILLCGVLHVAEAQREVPVSCRCVSASGWYCAQCPNLGLYKNGQAAKTCTGPGDWFAQCGCGV